MDEDNGSCNYDKYLTNFQCELLWLVMFMEKFSFYYISVAILILIIIISIFGKIKGNYRWFIVNQAIWDCLIIFDLTLCSTYFGTTKCFYRVYLSHPMWRSILNAFVSNMFIYNAYSAFLLLTFSRFLCLYYGDFYDKLTKKFRILWFILLPTMAFLLITALLSISQNAYSYKAYECLKGNASVKAACAAALKDDWDYKFHAAAVQILKKIDESKGPACIIGASIFSVLIVLKVSSQFRYQYYNNRKDFYGSFRIAVVLVLQLLMQIFLSFLETLSPIYAGYRAQDEHSFSPILQALSYQANLQAFRQLRILLECVIILAIMTGYRESIVKFFKWIFKGFRKQPISPAISNAFSSGIVFVNER